MSLPPVEPAIEAEVVRIYRRYATEVVEAFNFCPWAAGARAEGHVREFVVVDPDPSRETLLAVTEHAAADPEVEIGLVIMPRLVTERTAFEHRVAGLREAHDAAHAGRGIMAMAAFHPDAPADTTTGERLVPFIRRSPDPTIQLVRLSVLDAVRAKDPPKKIVFDPQTMDASALLEDDRRPVSQRVTHANFETVLEATPERLEAILADIARDRDEAYARLGW